MLYGGDMHYTYDFQYTFNCRYIECGLTIGSLLANRGTPPIFRAGNLV